MTFLGIGAYQNISASYFCPAIVCTSTRTETLKIATPKLVRCYCIPRYCTRAALNIGRHNCLTLSLLHLVSSHLSSVCHTVISNRTWCYVVEVASSGKVWFFFVFFMSFRGAERLTFCPVFRPFSREGNFRLPSTQFGAGPHISADI